MSFTPENLGLSDTGLSLLRDLVHERTGLYYDNGRCELLSDRLAPLVLTRGFRSFLDFYYLLKYDERAAGSEWLDVMNALSVQETYLWREVDQIRALACHLMPMLARSAGSFPIRIWSAPCATGEEPLSIAIALEEAGWFRRAPIEIHGSDGSTEAIARATDGRYKPRSLRSLPPDLAEKYFVEDAGIFRPIQSLRNRITSWSVVNLLSPPEVAVHAGSAVIFCRNAFIYFSPESVRRVVDMFADHMPTPGYLFVGAAESLVHVTNRFLLEDLDRAFVYVKR